MGGFNPTETAILLLGAVLLFAIMRIYRGRRNKGRNAATAGELAPSPEDYSTGVLIMAEQDKDGFLTHELPEWPHSHPRDASVAVATYDDGGKVALFLYEPDATPKLLWQGEIGTIALADLRRTASDSPTYHAEIDKMVLPLVREALGPVPINIEQP